MNPYDFLEQLAVNNNRPWFEAHRSEYEAMRHWWLERLDATIACMRQWWPEMGRVDGARSAYRIYRDTRFSPDKTPYKTYLSAALSPEGRKSIHAGFYLQLDLRAAENAIYGGVWCPERPVLNKLRRAIVDNIEEFEEIVNEPRLAKLFPGWCGRTLATVPKGYDRNHPQAWILRYNDLGKQRLVSRDFFLAHDMPERTAEAMEVLYPLIRFLNYSIDEDV